VKRQKELARQERQRLKALRRAARAADRKLRARGAPGEDPDIAGIVAGPQPLPWEGAPPGTA
jgi:hypothetical protein